MNFAIAGNPNSGKTTLFNLLTGSTAHVGNWPGVTVDRREGWYRKLAEPVRMIDLPGIYSLSPYTPEEIIARDYLLGENPDLIINIVDATNLERNLYLTTQLTETDIPMVIALNMTDVLERDGASVDTEVLMRELHGIPVLKISALRGDGIEELMQTAVKTASAPREAFTVLRDTMLHKPVEELRTALLQSNTPHPLFHAVKLAEGDERELKERPEFSETAARLRAAAGEDEHHGTDFESLVADLRYRFITARCSPAVTRPEGESAMTRSYRIDRVLTSRVFGIPIFLLFMFLVFHFTFGEDFLFLGRLGLGPFPSPGVWLSGLTESGLGALSGFAADGLRAAGASAWVLGLVVDGVLSGVFAVLGFLPQILLLFLFLSILEDTGYMARAAFLMDRVMRRFGLSGRAFMPLLMGFGCSVPAIIGTRTLASEKERRLTILLMPFFSCGAKLPIWAIFAGALFKNRVDLVVFGVYLLGIVTAGVAAIILKKTVFREQAQPFIMELPAYRLPRLSSLVIHLWEKFKHFLFRATTIVAGATVVIWVLSNFSFTFAMVEPNSADSMLGTIGGFIRPLFIPLGFASGDTGWRAVVAILTGFIAKEMVVSTMGVLYNPGFAGDALEDETAAGALAASLAAVFSPAAALSFMAFNLLSVPCMAAVAAAHGELGGRRKTFAAILFWLGTAWVVSFLINIAGTLVSALF